jgi:hypothetical protein
MKRTYFLILIIPALVAALAYLPIYHPKPAFHPPAEIARYQQQQTAFALHGTMFNMIDSNILFPTSRTCSGCHGYDPLKHALITTDGKDVNIYDDWRSTLMANSARDPFWRAKVTHEMLVNPAHSLDLQDKCTSCHAPGGNYQAKLKRHDPYYLLSDVYTDTLGLDGVNCQACHAQSPDLLGSLHSGVLHFDTAKIRVAYGPYEFIFAPPMHQFVGITPIYGPHIGDAGLCAGCHTLITKSVDMQGNYTGNTFVEQATYHEWLNSRYDKSHANITCQGCHMPRVLDEIIISTNYQFLTPKSPFGLHELAGANVPMLQLLKEHRQALGIKAEAEQFDSTIAATLRMLQLKTLDLSLQTGVLNGDYAELQVGLKNKSGHKFPSGYPSRRAWIELEVLDQIGNTVFHSGAMNSDYSLAGETAAMEPHYDVIQTDDQVQIYELVPGDVDGNFTTVLERGHIGLKDNRLTPQGFLLNDPVYDTTQIIGNALTDLDFNHFPNGSEGSGTDIVHYQVPTNNYTGFWKVTARVWYQSLPPKWMTPLLSLSTPEIDSFRNMLTPASYAPVLIATQVLDSVRVSPVATQNPGSNNWGAVTPTLTRSGQITITLAPDVTLHQVKVWNSAGQLVWNTKQSDILLPNTPGIYYVSVWTDRGMIRQKVVKTD